MTWTGTDLRCSREALGLSMVQLADYLGWKQSRISEAERGLRRVPEWVTDRMRALEEIRDILRQRMLTALEADPETVLIVHLDQPSYDAVHATDEIPAAVQRIAAALAAAEWESRTGERPAIVSSV